MQYNLPEVYFVNVVVMPFVYYLYIFHLIKFVTGNIVHVSVCLSVRMHNSKNAQPNFT